MNFGNIHNWNRKGLLWFFAILLVSAGQQLRAEDRVALVVGNGDYQHAQDLPNPSRDAAAIAKLLEGVGFKVITVQDAGVDKMFEGLESFKAQATGASMGLFYYAGHGMEVAGKNYLLPTDAELTSAAQLRTQTVSLDAVLEDMNACGLPAKLLILDCCRNNPLTRGWLTTRATFTGGLSALPDASIPKATMIMFASSPGEVALDGTTGNSPFTTALLQHLARPGVSAFDAFLEVSDAVAATTNERQVPWFNFDGAGRTFRLLSLNPGSLDIPAPPQSDSAPPRPAEPEPPATTTMVTSSPAKPRPEPVPAPASPQTTSAPRPTSPEPEPSATTTSSMPRNAAKLIPSGRAGLYLSPYAPGQGLVDGRGKRSGDVMTCPFSGKPVMVP